MVNYSYKKTSAVSVFVLSNKAFSSVRGADLLSSTHASYTCKNNSFNFVPHRTKTHESANLNICKYFVPNCKLISAFPERRLSLAQEGVKTNL